MGDYVSKTHYRIANYMTKTSLKLGMVMSAAKYRVESMNTGRSDFTLCAHLCPFKGGLTCRETAVITYDFACCGNLLGSPGRV